MQTKLKEFLLNNHSFINFDFLKLHIRSACYYPHARTSAYAIAKKYRQSCPTAFVRVLKVDDDYFVIIDKSDYEYYWELRKIAIRNERKMKNEIVQYF